MTAALTMIAAILWKTDIFFETNDDRFITEMLAGTITGEPDGHVVYLNYLLGLVLSWLYRITTQVPWYGGMLICFHALVYFLIFRSLLERCCNHVERMGALAIGGCFFLINIYCTAFIQYTSTAALLAGAGYVCLFMQNGKKKGLVEFWVLELLAFLVRSQAMMMIQPIGAAICISLYLTEKDITIHDRGRKIVRWAAAVGSVMVIGILGNAVGYRGQEWTEYQRYNDARTQLFDYYGKPLYEDVKDILDKYQVTQAEYAGFCSYVTIGGAIGSDCVEELAEYAKSRNQQTFDILELLKQLYESRDPEKYMKINRVVLFLWIAAAAWVVWFKRYYLAIPLLNMFLARNVVWIYMLYQGRLPNRVTFPLWSCEALLLLVLLFRDYVRSNRRIREKSAAMLVLLLGIVLCISAGKKQYRYCAAENKSQEIYMTGMKEVQDYCRQYPEQHFVLDNFSFAYYRGRALATDIYEKRNSVDTGCWYSYSPVMLQYCEQYLEDETVDIYLIVYDDGTMLNNSTVRYFEEKTGAVPVLADSMTAANEVKYLVWQFVK